MTPTRLLSTATLSLALAFTALISAKSYAQEQREDNKQQPAESRSDSAKHQDEKRDESKPARQEQAKPAEQSEDRMRQQDNRQNDGKQNDAKQNDARHEDKNAKQNENNARQENEHSGQQMNRGQNDVHAQRAGGGTRIPDDKFRSHFGRQHTFRVGHPTVVEGRPRFDYGGYSFWIVDPWPSDWAYTDDCYVDYIDGQYFLVDLAHPDMRIAIVVIS